MNGQLNTILMTLLQIIPKCLFKICFEAMKDLLFFFFVITRMRLFLEVTIIIILTFGYLFIF